MLFVSMKRNQLRDRRLDQPIESPYRIKEVCDQFSETLDGADCKVTGYHRRCYQNFTGDLYRLKTVKDTSEQPSTSQQRSSQKLIHGASNPKLGSECIFCEEVELVVDGTMERLSKCPTW